MVSYSEICKGLLDRPRNGLDRLSLTEVGKAAFDAAEERGLRSEMRKADPPFPWEMTAHNGDIEVLDIRAYFIGPSTFRSIFRIRALKGTQGEEILEQIVGSLHRDPLDSDYWNNDTWSQFSNKVGLSRDEVEGHNRENISS